MSIASRSGLLCLALVALNAAACMSSSVSPDLVRVKAASDLSCPGADLKIEKVTDNNWKVEGCKQTVTYMCSGSNFMSAGMCMREGSLAPPPAAPPVAPPAGK